jgi:hypothetical protein
MSPGKVRREFFAQQFRVAAGKNELVSFAMKSVDKQLPLREILDFIHQQIAGIAIQVPHSSKNIVVVREARQTLVVEVVVRVTADFLRRLQGVERFSRPSRTQNNFDERAFDPIIYFPLPPHRLNLPQQIHRIG